MDKSVLNEIDRLEGIAQAYKRRHPTVPWMGVLEDCDVARLLVSEIEEIEGQVEQYQGRLQEIQENMLDTLRCLDATQCEVGSAQRGLKKLMASLSARLER